jgi:hypothetical protein
MYYGLERVAGGSEPRAQDKKFLLSAFCLPSSSLQIYDYRFSHAISPVLFQNIYTDQTLILIKPDYLIFSYMKFIIFLTCRIKPL